MARIEDYALLGDLQTAALVERGGSIDWLCFPRFDSDACFAALLGGPENGRWLLAPTAKATSSRRYLHDTLVLETTWKTEDGSVARVLDFMPPRGASPDLVRIVEGVRGRVQFRSELTIRFGYGSVVPWVRKRTHEENTRVALAGPDALCFRTPAPTRGEDMRTVSELAVDEGERVPFVLTWFPSHQDVPTPIDAEATLAETETFWREWSEACALDLPPKRASVVRRSLIVLKALTYQPTGGIVAAPTTSLPEWIGSVRNWDYRYCWLRDATLTLLALLHCNHAGEAGQWRRWLIRAVAGDPADVQIMYGVAGERRLDEYELPWLDGYEGSAPVRVGNAASEQFQLDVYGEVLDCLYQARAHGLPFDPNAWRIQLALLEHVEEVWHEPDEGIWEIRGERRHFVHSKVMAWVAFDRAVRTIEEGHGPEGPVDRWRAVRDEIHREVCEKGFDATLGSFVQSYGSQELDASLLLLPLVGFLPHPTSAFAAPSKRSSASFSRTASSSATGRWLEAPTAKPPAPGRGAASKTTLQRSTGCRPAKASSCRARSGSPTATSCWAATTRRRRCSSGSSGCRTTSACCRRSTTRRPSACSATSHRRSRISRS